jgi:hypothetical protein
MMRWFVFLLTLLWGLCNAQTLHKHHHTLAERLAHFDVYELGTGVNGGMRADAQGKKNIENTMGLKVLDTLYDIPDGFSSEHQQDRFAAMVVQDTNRQPPQTFIVFRGTDDQEDVVQYLETGLRGKVEVGQQQFQKYHEHLQQWARLYPDAVVTGHSLGGALAQRYVAEFPKNCKELVTFQAPGTEEEVARRLDAFGGKNTLYVSVGDKVSSFGARHGGSPDVVVVEVEGADAKEAHKNLLLQEKGATSPYASKSTGQKIAYNPKGQVRSLKRVQAEEYQSQRGLLWDGVKDLKDQGTTVVVKVQLQGGPPSPQEAPQVIVEGVHASAHQNEARVRVPSYIRPGEIIHIHASAEGYPKKVRSFTVLDQTNPIFVSINLERRGPMLQAEVRDQETQQVLSGARVEAEGSISASTDSSGRASLALEVVKDATAWVKVSCKGYHSRSGRVRINQSQARIAVGLKPILKMELEGPRQALAGEGGKAYAARLVGGSLPYEFSWFIDGVEQAARGPKVEVNWVTIGDHQLACEAREQSGLSRIKCIAVRVDPGRLSAELTGPARVQSGQKTEHLLKVTGGVPPYTFEWWMDGQRANVSAHSQSVNITWAPPFQAGQHTLRGRVQDQKGSTLEAEQRVELAATAAPATAAGPVDAAYAPTPGRLTGVIEKRLEDRSLRPYPGLELAFDGEKVAGRLQTTRDQGMLMDWRFSGGWAGFVRQGESQSRRRLNGTIRGTVNGVHLVEGSFVVSEASANLWQGSWNVTFKANGVQWKGRFRVQR